MPQKEPSPLLDKKIEELEAKFADMTDEELEDLGDDDGDGLDGQGMSQLQTPLHSDLDMMSYTPIQVTHTCSNQIMKKYTEYNEGINTLLPKTKGFDISLDHLLL